MERFQQQDLDSKILLLDLYFDHHQHHLDCQFKHLLELIVFTSLIQIQYHQSFFLMIF